MKKIKLLMLILSAAICVGCFVYNNSSAFAATDNTEVSDIAENKPELAIKEYYDYDSETVNTYRYVLNYYDIGNSFTLDGHAPSFYVFLKKGYLSYCYCQTMKKLFEEFADNEQAMADIVKIIDLLTKYGCKDQYDIYGFIEKYQQLPQKDFKQLLSNLETFQINKVGMSDRMKKEILRYFSYSSLSKPIAKSYFLLLKQLSDDELDYDISLVFGNNKDENGNEYSITMADVINKYAGNEKISSYMLQNYNLLAQSGVLKNSNILRVICAIDWDTYNGNNYALKLVNIMKDSNLYSDDDINYWVRRINWTYIKGEPIPEAIPFIKGGYLKYFQHNMYYNNVPEYKKTFLSDFMRIIDLMKQYNMNNDAIECVVIYSDWSKTDETYEIIKYMVQNGKTSSDIDNVFNNNYYQVKVYDIYEKIISDINITDKETIFIKKLNKSVKTTNRKMKTRKAMNTTGGIIKTTGVAITAPIWVPIIIYGLSQL